MKLAKLKVVEMRKELEARGLDSTGTRPTLMKRLREALKREQSTDSGQQQQRPNQPRENLQNNHPGNGHLKDEKSYRENPKLRNSPVMTTEETGVKRESKKLPQSTKNQKASSTQEIISTNEPPQVSQVGKSCTSGSIEGSREISMDERMQMRQQRFGTANIAPNVTKEAIQRRRKRFGVVEKPAEERPTKRPRTGDEVDEEALREYEEAKKRRAIKFGVSLNSGKELGAGNTVTADEMERRLKRQRRFQHVGS